MILRFQIVLEIRIVVVVFSLVSTIFMRTDTAQLTYILTVAWLLESTYIVRSSLCTVSYLQ